MEAHMRSIISAVGAFSFILAGTVAVVQAQEIPETFLTVGPPFQKLALQSPDQVNKNAGGPYINHIPNCTVLGQRIYPCG